MCGHSYPLKRFDTHGKMDINSEVMTVKNPAIEYEIMHSERTVARVATNGRASVLDEQFMPYDLCLKDDCSSIDTMINNVINFYHWCASRLMPQNRQYAKEILNAIGMSQSVTDRDRAMISLSYHCVSLTDVYWVRKAGEEVTFAQLNLYDNPLNEAIVPLPLRGKQLTVTNQELAPDLSTKGLFPKAWIRTEDGFVLLKDGGEDIVRRELLASRICQCFDIPQVVFEIYAINHDLDVVEACVELDAVTYYGMNILDYLIGNTDRHPENWGLLVDNRTNKPVSLYPLMDFNQSFLSYDTIDGANCQTVYPKRQNQREAAVEAVQQIGLRQIRDVDVTWFEGMEKEAEMFLQRLDVLKAV